MTCDCHKRKNWRDEINTWESAAGHGKGGSLGRDVYSRGPLIKGVKAEGIIIMIVLIINTENFYTESANTICKI